MLRAARDPDIFTAFWKEFASYEKPIPAPLLFSVIIYAYCWARGWSANKNDTRVSKAYEDAASIIASRFKDAAKLVRVSDYVVSEFELAELSVYLIASFREQIPLNIDPNADIKDQVKANLGAI